MQYNPLKKKENGLLGSLAPSRAGRVRRGVCTSPGTDRAPKRSSSAERAQDTVHLPLPPPSPKSSKLKLLPRVRVHEAAGVLHLQLLDACEDCPRRLRVDVHVRVDVAWVYDADDEAPLAQVMRHAHRHCIRTRLRRPVAVVASVGVAHARRHLRGEKHHLGAAGKLIEEDGSHTQRAQSVHLVLFFKHENGGVQVLRDLLQTLRLFLGDHETCIVD
mmetsp:Transcript_14005/g.28971  ORF Transcript_14005/g.28971 Transcript_14005/m.28971 type:complete len:217 (+) Transcript_14005:37-687(+)